MKRERISFKHLKNEKELLSEIWRRLFGITSLEQSLSHRLGPITVPKKVFFSQRIFLSKICLLRGIQRNLYCISSQLLLGVSSKWPNSTQVVTHSPTLELPIWDDFKATRFVAKFFTICGQSCCKYFSICRPISHQICRMIFSAQNNYHFLNLLKSTKIKTKKIMIKKTKTMTKKMTIKMTIKMTTRRQK